MTIYDAVATILSLYPNLSKPNYIAQYGWFDSSVFDKAVRYLPVEIFDGDGYTIIHKDWTAKTMVIISTTEMKLLNPGKHKIFELSPIDISVLWDMVQKETSFNTVKTQATRATEYSYEEDGEEHDNL